MISEYLQISNRYRTDTGKGIEDKILTSVFESFEKSSYAHLLNDNTRLLVGDGLDLSVVARIVSSLGGQLQIKSKIGQGSKVILLLPFRLPTAGIETDTTQLSDAFQSSFGGISIGGTESIGDSTIVDVSEGISISNATILEAVPINSETTAHGNIGGVSSLGSENSLKE